MKIQIHTIAIAAIFGIFTSPSRWWLCSFLILHLFFNRHRLSVFAHILIVSTYLFFLIYTPFYISQQGTQLTPNTSMITGKIISTPVIDGNHMTFHFKLPHKETLMVHYQIQTEIEQKELRKLYYGDRCSLSGTLERPPVNRNFYGFDYRTYLERSSNIHWIYKTNNLSSRECTRGNGLLVSLYRFRQNGIILINEEFPKELSGMMNTLIFGDRSGIDESLQEQYQSLGLIHLLAVSGLHIGTILGLFYFLMIRIGIVKETALWVLLLIIPFIIVLTGGAASVIRAGLMAVVVCLVALFRIKITTFSQLCMIFLGLLLYKPTFAYNIGFQLSFLITASLILSSKVILREISPFRQLLYGSFIAQLASLPIVIWNFYEFSLWSLPVNMIFIPFMTAFLLPCVLTTFCMFLFFPFPVWGILSGLLSVCFKILHAVMQWVETLPIGVITLGRPNVILMSGLSLSFYLFLIAWEKGGKRLISPCLCILLVLGIQLYYPKMDDMAFVTFLDVGQGDSIVIELPYRRAVYVIDTGGAITFKKEEWMERRRKFDTGEDIVAEFLKARGIRKVDALILSHGDFDHIGGVDGLLKKVKVERIVYGKSDHLEASEVEFLKGLDAPIVFLNENISWRVGSSSFQTLNPDQAKESRNNRSLVLFVKIHGNSFLFTGDIDQRVEARIISHYPGLKVDNLKVAHHGSESSTSSSFLNEINPQTAFISVGENNRYNHPSTTVIERLEERRTDIYRTDRQGGIMVIITPEGKRISTVLPKDDINTK